MHIDGSYVHYVILSNRVAGVAMVFDGKGPALGGLSLGNAGSSNLRFEPRPSGRDSLASPRLIRTLLRSAA